MMSAIAQWMNLRGVEDDTHLNQEFNLDWNWIELCFVQIGVTPTDISISKGDVNGPYWLELTENFTIQLCQLLTLKHQYCLKNIFHDGLCTKQLNR